MSTSAQPSADNADMRQRQNKASSVQEDGTGGAESPTDLPSSPHTSGHVLQDQMKKMKTYGRTPDGTGSYPQVPANLLIVGVTASP